MINLYETKSVKKFLPKKNNPSYKNTSLDLNSRILVVGASGSGKTNWLGNYLMLADGTFNHIHILYKETEPIYDAIREQMKGKGVSFYTNPNDLPSLTNMRNDSEGEQNPDDNVLLIIDDWVNEANSSLYKKTFSDIFIRGRKFVTTIFISQQYFTVPKLMRSQCTYIILIKISSNKDLKLILSDYTLSIEPAELLKYFEKATEKKFDFFKLDIHSADANRKYSHNWKGFFQVENKKEPEK